MVTADGVRVRIVPNDKGSPPGKLADAELYFGGAGIHEEVYNLLTDLDNAGEARVQIATDLRKRVQQALINRSPHQLAGLKLIGFAIWERRTGTGRNVTFPSRQYSVNGERRSFALLRPIVDANAQDAIRTLILDAYTEYENRAAAIEETTAGAE